MTVRTIYRDIAALRASRVPIEGAAGLGSGLRRGFDLPPPMLTAEEADAIAIGVRLLRRLRDPTCSGLISCHLDCIFTANRTRTRAVDIVLRDVDRFGRTASGEIVPGAAAAR